MNTCASCQYCGEGELSASDLKKPRICRYDPPKPFPVGTQGGVAVITAWPTVNPETDYCSRYTVKFVSKRKRRESDSL